MGEHLGRSASDYEALVLQQLSSLPGNMSAISAITNILEDMEENFNIAMNQEESRGEELLKILHESLTQIWQGKPNKAFAYIDVVYNSNQTNQIGALALLLRHALTQHILQEITLNYTNLSNKELQKLLAINEVDLQKMIQKLNWRVDETGYVYPDTKYLMDKERFKQINQEQIDQIVKLTSFLDSLQ